MIVYVLDDDTNMWTVFKEKDKEPVNYIEYFLKLMRSLKEFISQKEYNMLVSDELVERKDRKILNEIATQRAVISFFKNRKENKQ